MIRPASPSDATAIAEIWNRVIRDSTITFTTEEKTSDEIAALIAHCVCLVVEDRGEVAGFAIYGAFRAGPGYRFTAEHSLYVRTESQGFGHGRVLMLALEDAARNDGIRVLIAGVGGENAGARAFHERLGFRKAGHLRGVGEKFGRRQDLILMTKDL